MNTNQNEVCPAIQNVLRCNSGCLGCASFKRKVKEVEQTVSSRDGLIQMLQNQIKKYEQNYKNLLDEFEEMRFQYCSAVQELTSLREINKKLEEESDKYEKRGANKTYPNLEDLEDELQICKNQCKDLSNKLNRIDNEGLSPVGNCGYKDILNEVSNIENLVASQTNTLKGMLSQVLNELSNTKVDNVNCKKCLEKIFSSKSTGIEDADNKNNEIKSLQKEIQTLTNLVDKYKVENENVRKQLLDTQISASDYNLMSDTECVGEVNKLKNILARKDDEIDELKQKIDALETESREKEKIFDDCRCRLTEQICQLQENNAMLGDTLTIVTQENKSNLDAVNNLRRSLTDTEKKYEMARQESDRKLRHFSDSITDYKNIEKTSDHEIARLRRQIDQYRRQTDELRDRITARPSVQDVKELQDEIVQLKKDLEEKTLENTEYEEENKYYCQKIEALMQTVNELQAITKSDSATQAEVSRLPSAVQTDEDSRITEMRTLNESLEGKLGEIVGLQKNMEAKTSDYEKLKGELVQMRRASADLETERGSLNQKVKSSRQELKSKESEIKTLTEQRAKLQKQVAELLKEQDDKTTQLRDINKEVNKLRQGAIDEEKLKKRLKELEQENSKLTHEMSAFKKCRCGDITSLLNNEIERLQSDNNKKQATIAQLEETVDRAKKIMCECEEEVKLLADENKTLKTTLDGRRKDCDELGKAAEKHRRRSDQLQTDYDRLTKKESEEIENYRRLSQDLQREQDDNKTKAQQLENVKKKMEAIDKDNVSLQIEVSELKREVADLLERLETSSDRFNRQSQDLEREKSRLSEEFDTTARKFSNAQDEIKDWKNRYNQLESEHKRLDEIYTDLSKRYEAKCKELERLKNDFKNCCDKSEEELDTLRKNLSKSQEEVLQARRRVNNLQEEMDRCICEIKQANDSYKKICEEYENSSSFNETQLGELRTNLSKSQTETIQARSAMDKYRDEMDRCLCEANAERDDYRYQCDALKEEAANLKETLKKLQEEYRKKCEEYEVCCSMTESEIEQLRQNLSKSQTEAMQARYETDSLRKEMDLCLCELNKEKDNYMSQCDALTTELNRSKADLKQLQVEQRKKVEDYDVLRTEYTKCCEESDSKIEALKGELSVSQTETIEARRKVETIRKEMEECVCDIEERCSEYKQRSDVLTSEKEKLYKDYRSSLELQQTTNEDYEQLKNKYRILSEQFKEKITELSEMKEKLEHCCDQTEQEINKLMRKLNISQDEIMKERSENSRLREEIERCACELNEAKTIQKRKKDREDEEKNDELQQLKAKYKILSEQYKEKMGELAVLKEQCTVSSKKCQITREEYNNLKKEYKEIKAMLSDQIRKCKEDLVTHDTPDSKKTKSGSSHELKQKLLEKEVQARTLQARVNEQEQEIDYLKENYQRVHAENSILKTAINNLISNIENKIKGTDDGLERSSAEMIASEILNSLTTIESQIAGKGSYPRCSCIQEIMSKYGVLEACSEASCQSYCDKVLQVEQRRQTKGTSPVKSTSAATSSMSLCDETTCDCVAVLGAVSRSKMSHIMTDLKLDEKEVLKHRCINIERCLSSMINIESRCGTANPSCSKQSELQTDSFIVEPID